MAKYIKVKNHGANRIDLSHIGDTAKELFPTELHFNKNGSVDNKPTFAIVMHNKSGLNVYGQFSFKTLQECLNELGYEISKKVYFYDIKESANFRVQCRNYLMAVNSHEITVEDALEEFGYGCMESDLKN